MAILPNLEQINGDVLQSELQEGKKKESHTLYVTMPFVKTESRDLIHHKSSCILYFSILRLLATCGKTKQANRCGEVVTANMLAKQVHFYTFSRHRPKLACVLFCVFSHLTTRVLTFLLALFWMLFRGFNTVLPLICSHV